MQYPSVDNSPFNLWVKCVVFLFATKEQKLSFRKKSRSPYILKMCLTSGTAGPWIFSGKTSVCWILCKGLLVRKKSHEAEFHLLITLSLIKLYIFLTEETFSLITFPYIIHCSRHKGILCPVLGSYCGQGEIIMAGCPENPHRS